MGLSEEEIRRKVEEGIPSSVREEYESNTAQHVPHPATKQCDTGFGFWSHRPTASTASDPRNLK